MVGFATSPYRESNGPPCAVSVRQATDPEFGSFVAETLIACQVDPEALVLQITESLMLHESIPAFLAAAATRQAPNRSSRVA